MQGFGRGKQTGFIDREGLCHLFPEGFDRRQLTVHQLALWLYFSYVNLTFVVRIAL